VTRCAITPDFAVAKAGSKVKFWVSAWAGQEPVVVKEGATWAAPAMSPLSAPMPATGASAEFSVGTAATSDPMGVNGAQATIGGATCTAKVIVVAAPASGGEVVVIDELSGRPVPNAQVVVSDAMGAVIAQPSQVTTSATGVGVFTFGNATSYSVSVFHPDYAYTTIANYQPAGSAASEANVLHVAMRRNSVANHGGFRGNFADAPTGPNIKIGIAGASLAGALTNLNVTQLAGPSRKTRIKLGSQIDQEIDLPDGVYLVFADTNKNSFAGLGLAGTCGDESKVRSGTCGTRSAWSFSGELQIGDITPLIAAFMGGFDNIKIGDILAQAQPVFRKLSSSIVRDVTFDLKQTPCKGGKTPPNCTDGFDFSDNTFYAAQNMKWASVPLFFGFAVKSPKLPTYRGRAVDGALAVTGVQVPGRGVIPLGLGASVNAMPADDVLDIQEPLKTAGLIPVRTAPAHSGTEGSELGIILGALSAASFSDPSAQVGASALFVRPPENKFPFDPQGMMPIDASTQTYPVYPESARFNAGDAPSGGLGPRGFRFLTSSVASALGSSVQVIRVSFNDEAENRWDVMVDASQAGTGFVLPKPPAGFRDRLFETGMTTGPRSSMGIQALRLSAAPSPTGGSPLSFKQLVEFNGTNYERLTTMLTGFAFLDYGRPKISFKMSVPATAMKGTTKVTVKVERFKIGTAMGDDGLVKLSFLDGGAPKAGCDVSSSTELMAGRGEVELTIPATCSGANLTAKAQLFYSDMSPVGPEVSVTQSSITVQ
jgi:hypothetical protein